MNEYYEPTKKKMRYEDEGIEIVLEYQYSDNEIETYEDRTVNEDEGKFI